MCVCVRFNYKNTWNVNSWHLDFRLGCKCPEMCARTFLFFYLELKGVSRVGMSPAAACLLFWQIMSRFQPLKESQTSSTCSVDLAAADGRLLQVKDEGFSLARLAAKWESYAASLTDREIRGGKKAKLKKHKR